MKIKAKTPYDEVVSIVGFVYDPHGIQAMVVNQYGVIERYHYCDLNVIDEEYKPSKGENQCADESE